MKKTTPRVGVKICTVMQVGDDIGLEQSGGRAGGMEWTHVFWREMQLSYKQTG